jgi:uncharacterized protein (TIGR02246 family)
MTSSMMASAAIAVAISATAAAGATEPAAQARAAVQAALDASAAAWNAGDLDRFMACYERAATTTYVSGTRFVQGYDAIRANYAERFGGGTRAAMGQLSLEIVDFRMVGSDHAYVVGRFHLHRDAAHGGDASGPTTLLFRRTAAGWRIIADHS